VFPAESRLPATPSSANCACVAHEVAPCAAVMLLLLLALLLMHHVRVCCLCCCCRGVDCLAYSAGSSSTLLSSGRDGQVCSMDTAKGSKQGQFKGSKHAVTAAALSAGGWEAVQCHSAAGCWDSSHLRPSLSTVPSEMLSSAWGSCCTPMVSHMLSQVLLSHTGDAASCLLATVAMRSSLSPMVLM
jgi:hypothetical protein